MSEDLAVGDRFFNQGQEWEVEEIRPAPTTFALRHVRQILIATRIGQKTQFVFHVHLDGMIEKVNLLSYR